MNSFSTCIFIPSRPILKTLDIYGQITSITFIHVIGVYIKQNELCYSINTTINSLEHVLHGA